MDPQDKVAHAYNMLYMERHTNTAYDLSIRSDNNEMIGMEPTDFKLKEARPHAVMQLDLDGHTRTGNAVP
jgi:hypothetical protein